MIICILPQDKVREEEYLISVDTYSQIGSIEYKNRAEWIVKLTLLDKNNDGFLFKKNILKFHQTNNRGYNALDEDMVQLKSELIFRTDINGLLLNIENRKDIIAKWEKLKPGLYSKYRNVDQIATVVDSLDNVFDAQERLNYLIFSATDNNLLFPNVYGLYDNEHDKKTDYKTLPAFIGTLGLPLQLNVEFKEYDNHTNACKILKTGKIDYGKYPKKEVADFLRAGTGQFNQRTENIQFEHIESYEFDEKHWLTAAGQFTDYSFPGVLRNRTVGYAYTVNKKPEQTAANKWTAPLHEFTNFK